MQTIPNSPKEDEISLAILAFKVHARQFDLNRDLAFVSMKDQVLRGRTLMISADKAGLLKPNEHTKNCDVLVVGGGVGGISVALTACERGYSAIVIEPEKYCFPVLGLGSDRLFSTTVYDWPHGHFNTHTFPFMPSMRTLARAIDLRKEALVLEFPNQPMKASELRKTLLGQLKKIKKSEKKLSIRNKHSLHKFSDVSINESTNTVTTIVKRANGTDEIIKSSIVVFAMGFGLGADEHQSTAARNFFAYSTLEEDIQKASTSPDKVVQILGDGDGGLQESLRFIFKPEMQDLAFVVKALDDELMENHSSLWLNSLATLRTAEDQALRSFMWGYEENILFKELHEVYASVLGSLVSNCSAEVETWGKTVLRDSAIKVEIVGEYAFSKRVYPLNRFLTMLLAMSASIPSKASLRKVVTKDKTLSPSVELSRGGFASGGKPKILGTANADDLLQRIAFRGVPMNLDAVY